MAFYGKTFTFTDIKGREVPSETYNLYISSPNGGEVSTSGGSNVELYTESIYRRPKVYLYGAQQTPVLSFPVSINAPSELSSWDAELVQKWLFGRLTYNKLFIMQEDMQDVYFNCFLVNSKIKRTGNVIVGFDCDVVCDSPFAWTPEKTLTYTFTTSTTLNYLVRFFNMSDNAGYLYPKVTFTTRSNISNAYITILNASDANRTFSFTGLSVSETIIVDNDLQIITTSAAPKRLSNFNKNFFRFVQGVNDIAISGNITSLSFTYNFAKKIGG